VIRHQQYTDVFLGYAEWSSQSLQDAVDITGLVEIGFLGFTSPGGEQVPCGLFQYNIYSDVFVKDICRKPLNML
jgi:hypothetical protein